MPHRPLIPRALGAAGILALLTLAACPPAEPPPARYPTALPPQPPSTAPVCESGQVLQGGQWQWRNGQWAWEAPRCTRPPDGHREGCVWVRGLWRKGAERPTFTAGRWSCPPPRPR